MAVDPSSSSSSSSSSMETIMEEREELMVPPNCGNPTLRTAHFLNPTCLTSIATTHPIVPPLSLSSIFRKNTLRVRFKGRLRPQIGWESWVQRLQPTYQHIWKMAGIYDAILASTYQTLRDNELVVGLAERWCVETNSFIFPWGEATLTLEDMVVLGGYSVLGSPVFEPLQTQECGEIEQHLIKAQRDIKLGNAGVSSHYAWMEHFMKSGDHFEHEGFLVLWLSRYVFPYSSAYVARKAFPIAIHLSRGTQIALAPAVLASIYRDLSLLKKSMDNANALTKLRTDTLGDDVVDCDSGVTLDLWAPLHLVQLWAWERFPTLRPNPNPILCGEPRPARWHNLKFVPKLKLKDVGMAIDSARESFQWRPYSTVANNWMLSSFYMQNEGWVLVKSDMVDKELESFGRCLRASELVGLDCIEQYLPHRVAMQFGMDQDVPGYVPRSSNVTPEIAWINYTRPIKDAQLYLPHRLFESDVTKRYSEWWKQSMLAYQGEIKRSTVMRRQRSKTHRRLPRVFGGQWNGNVYEFFPSRHVKVEVVDEDKLTISKMLRHDENFVPSGFPSKRIKVEDVDEDNLTIAEKMRRHGDRHKNLGDGLITMPPSENTIFEKREALMVSPTGGIPILRTAHFLHPIVTHIHGPALKPPSLSDESKWRVMVSFYGWRDPPKKWKPWVDHMHSLHQSTWKKVGIYEAVMASTHTIRVNRDLVLEFAERWCSDTNVFIFPWGEATITLEDMMVLGGYSVLGSSVFKPLHTQELLQIEENLNQVRLELVRSRAQKAHHSLWIKHFMQSGSEIEHEAFLALWLSRFVLPGYVQDTISKHAFPIAVQLARGTRIALAPAVLASLYRDLTLLKETIVSSTELEADAKCDSSLAVTVWAPLRLAQCWVWERFPSLRPQPNVIEPGEPRMARWQSPNRSSFQNVRQAIDSAGETFQWRPYVIAVDGLSLPKFYREKEEWLSNSPSLDEELESFVRCMRVCELVGLDCREQYLPHRVAMQFGLDQDLPGWVSRSNATSEVEWNNYCRPFSDAKLYIPSRLSEADVTTQYREWWKGLVFVSQGAIEGTVQRERSPRRLERLSQTSKEMKVGKDADVPPGFPDVPPGFPPKRPKLEADKHTHVEMLRSVSDEEPLFDGRSQSPSSSASDNGICRSTRPIQEIMLGECATKRSVTGIEDAHRIDSVKSNEEESSRDFTFRLPELELEARIMRLEIVVAVLKAAKFGDKYVK